MEEVLIARKPTYEKLEQRAKELQALETERKQTEEALRRSEHDTWQVNNKFQTEHTEAMLTEEKKEYFKKILTQRLGELLTESNKTVNVMTGLRERFPDPSDRASVESERNFTLRIRDRERRLIGKIKEGLESIDNGTYGICEKCDEEISEGRLQARPVTTLCIECKKKQEDEVNVK